MITFEQLYRHMRERLDGIVPEVELKYKADLAYEVLRLKEEKNAIILGHNYMEPALFHSVCDVKGDSLELSRKAMETDMDVIVFCGVQFMAETAKILNPLKTVLIPSDHAGCSVAASVTAEDVRKLKKKYPGVPVVSYINTYADVKAESDICCTSGNAAKVVDSLDSDYVIFLPDEYLAQNVARETGRKMITPSVLLNGEKNILIGWNGRCEVHEQFTVEDISNVRRQFPNVEILAHPECSPEVVVAADFSGSTGAMISHVKDSNAPHYLLLTECTMGDNIAAENKGKEMLRLCSVRCQYMNQITLEDTIRSLREMRFVVEVPEEIRKRAYHAVDRMLHIG